jgi:hypothetical protein
VGYQLQAVLAAADLLTARAADLPEAAVVPLDHGMALVPMTERLADALDSGAPDPGTESLRFVWLPNGFDRVLADWSAAGPVAYVEADYFGGVGSQRAVVWLRGEVVLGPLGVAPGQPHGPRAARSPARWPASGWPATERSTSSTRWACAATVRPETGPATRPRRRAAVARARTCGPGG